MAATPVGVRATASTHERVAPADAAPGTPSSQAQGERPKLQALTRLLSETDTQALNKMGENALPVAVTVAGLDEGEAEALRAGTLVSIAPYLSLTLLSPLQPSVEAWAAALARAARRHHRVAQPLPPAAHLRPSRRHPRS